MNDTWIVDLGSSRCVLRRHRLGDRASIESAHQVMAVARDGGVPVPGIIAARDGADVVDHDDRWWTLYEHAPGEQLDRGTGTPAHAEAMGDCLGRLHQTLAALPAEPSAPRAAPAADEVLAAIGRLAERIEGLADPVPSDGWGLTELRERTAWITEHGVPRTRVLCGRQQVRHGDFQDTNVFFAGGTTPYVSAVIDWDKVDVGSPAVEIVRAIEHAFDLDPERGEAFLRGYRRHVAVSWDDLDDAAWNYSADRVCGLWLFEELYERDNDRVRQFLAPGGFVPLADRWRSFRQAVNLASG